MTIVHLHVGMPKCASSALQSMLYRNEARHRAEGLCYPAAFRDEGGYFSHRPLHRLQPEEIPAAIDTIAREADEAGCDRIVISSEEFTNSLWDKPVTGAIVDALNARFGVRNTRILMLFRNHFPFVESVYAQFLKGGMFRTPDEGFMKQPHSGINPFAANFRQRNGFDFFSYGDFIERMRFHAPENPFDLLSIERADHDGQDILDVLCARWGISRGEEPVSANIRYSETALALLHHARKTHGFQQTRARRNMVANLFPPEQGKPFSRLLHVHGLLHDQIMAAAERDRRYFQRHGAQPAEALFAMPAGFEGQRDRADELTLPAWGKALVDEIMTRDQIGFSQARALRDRMAGKAEGDAAPGRNPARDPGPQ